MQQLKTNRTFGVEFEGYGIDRNILAHHLREAGIDAQLANYSGSNYQIWQVKYDSSVSGQDGFEIVSPVLQGDDGLRDVEKVLTVVNELGGDANKSCGFHIHWGVQNWGIRKFRNLYKRWGKFEFSLDSIMPPSRRKDANTYCKSMYNLIIGSDWERDSLVDNCRQYFAKIDRVRNVQSLVALQNNYWGRYHKLNMCKYFRTGTIEFRQHSGTFNYEKVMAWIHLTASFIVDADNNKGISIWKDNVSQAKGLSTLLNASKRVGNINQTIVDFYKARAKEMRETT